MPTIYNPMQIGPGPQAREEGHQLSLSTTLLCRAVRVAGAGLHTRLVGTSSLEPAEASQALSSHLWAPGLLLFQHTVEVRREHWTWSQRVQV